MAGTALGTFITYNPLAVSLETTVDRLLELVDQLHMHHFPVVDDGGRLIGLVSETDILRALRRKRSPVERIPIRSGSGTNSILPDRADAGTENEPLRAESLVSRNLVTIGPSATPRQALALLLEHRIHSLPVLENGRLLGIVTSSDFLREFSYGELPGSRDSISGHLSPPPEALEPDATLAAAERSLRDSGRDHVAVVQGGCPVGLVSQVDLVRARCRALAAAGASGAEPEPRVTALMRRTPPVRPGQRLCEAAALMVEHQLPALVVTNQANRFLGILADSDVLTLMQRQLR